jgi:lipopolysaccharide transport system permease protein
MGTTNAVEDSLVQLPSHPCDPVLLTADLPVQVIEAPSGWISINWGEIWRYRELLYFLVWRDVKVRYKQTALGIAWAILQPLATMLIFTLFFGRWVGLEQKTGGVPYPIHVYMGLLLWTFFANAISGSGASVVGNANLITKIYFPRLIIPLAAVGAGLVDLATAFPILLGMMVVYGTPLSWQLLLAPMMVVGTVLAAAGVGTLLAALTVAYRDFRYTVPFLVQVWMFVTPVIYPTAVAPARWRWLLFLNPMTGLIEGFRAAFLALPINWSHIALSLAASLLMFLFGASYFRRVERQFADVI